MHSFSGFLLEVYVLMGASTSTTPLVYAIRAFRNFVRLHLPIWVFHRYEICNQRRTLRRPIRQMSEGDEHSPGERTTSAGKRLSGVTGVVIVTL